MLELDPIPACVRTLTDAERERLMAKEVPLKDLSNCVTCRGTKTFRWYGPDGEIADYRCNCRDQFVLHRFLFHSGIGLGYQRLGWSDAKYVAKESQEAVLKYGNLADAYTNRGVGLLLHGEIGTGKTFLATLLLRMMISAGHEVYMTSFQELIDHYTDGWRDKEEKVWFHRRIRNVGVLCIDDLGREYKNRNLDMIESMLDEVVRARVAACLPMIITTNKSVEQMRTSYQANVMDLLAESCIQHEFHGESYRTSAQERHKAEIALGLTRPVTLA